MPVGDATGAGAGAVVGVGWGSWRLLVFFFGFSGTLGCRVMRVRGVRVTQIENDLM